MIFSDTIESLKSQSLIMGFNLKAKQNGATIRCDIHSKIGVGKFIHSYRYKLREISEAQFKIEMEKNLENFASALKKWRSL